MKRNLAPMLMMVVGVLLILGALAWYLVMARSPINGQTRSGGEETPGEVPRISVSEAKSAYDAGNAVFVDVRGENFYTDQHIPGALSIPLLEIPQRMGELNSSDWIITY